MSKTDLTAIIAVCVALVIGIVGTVWVVSSNSTQRQEQCVANGGEYVNVPETSRMECQR